MSWFTNFLTSSIGNKILMSLTGLFLSLFLVVHLAGNLQLLVPDGGKSFIEYAEIMESNLLIKIVALVLYATIVLHAVKGIAIWLKNRRARGNIKYARKSAPKTSWASRNMALLGTIILIFIVVHMSQFWYYYKFTELEGKEPYTIIVDAFQQPWIVIFYVAAQAGLAWHLLHGFQSAFQTLGWRQGKYTSIIQGIGYVYAIAIPLLFAIIPIMVYFELHLPISFTVIPGQG